VAPTVPSAAVLAAPVAVRTWKREDWGPGRGGGGGVGRSKAETEANTHKEADITFERGFISRLLGVNKMTFRCFVFHRVVCVADGHALHMLFAACTWDLLDTGPCSYLLACPNVFIAYLLVYLLTYLLA
jgi:hypothetical protein